MTSSVITRGLYKSAKPLEKRGWLIACEGVDAAGKSTVVSSVMQYLDGEGIKNLSTNWNETAEAYNVWMDASLEGHAPRDLGLYFPAFELAARYHYIISPALCSPCVVFVTKYVVSAFSHALVRGYSEELVRRLYRFAPEPDLTLYFDLVAGNIARVGSERVPTESASGKQGWIKYSICL